MLRRPTVSGGGPSFFYLMLAQSCFRRARATPHPKGGGTLWQIGRNYLVSARRVTSMLESDRFDHAAPEHDFDRSKFGKFSVTHALSVASRDTR
jgi:hypothetical protein